MQSKSIMVACVLLLTAFISKCVLNFIAFFNDISLILREGQGDDWPFRLYLILSQKSGLLKSVVFWSLSFVFLI